MVNISKIKKMHPPILLLFLVVLLHPSTFLTCLQIKTNDRKPKLGDAHGASHKTGIIILATHHILL